MSDLASAAVIAAVVTHEWPKMESWQHTYLEAALPLMVLLVAVDWLIGYGRHLLEEGRKMLPEMAGGFVAYVIHTVHHTIFRRPGHRLARWITRKEVDHH